MKIQKLLLQQFKHTGRLPHTAYVNFDLIYDIKTYQSIHDTLQTGCNCGDKLTKKDMNNFKKMIKKFHLQLD